MLKRHRRHSRLTLMEGLTKIRSKVTWTRCRWCFHNRCQTSIRSFHISEPCRSRWRVIWLRTSSYSAKLLPLNSQSLLGSSDLSLTISSSILNFHRYIWISSLRRSIWNPSHHCLMFHHKRSSRFSHQRFISHLLWKKFHLERYHLLNFYCNQI